MGTNGVVTIPGRINGRLVTSIGEGAFSPFQGNAYTSSVTMYPDSVTKSPDAVHAFDEDQSLENITQS